MNQDHIYSRAAVAAIGFIVLFTIGSAGRVSALTGEEILRKVDQNMAYDSISYAATFAIYSGETVRTKQMKAVAVGTSKALVEFTNPEDNGTKYLKIDKNLWIYFPSEQDTVKISGHMLKEGMMGSDVSYEDALESEDLYKKYDVTLDGTDTVDGRLCYVLKLAAQVRDVPYEVRKIWVDEERFTSLREEMYAKSGRLLKVSRTLEVRQIEGRYFPVKVEMSDQLRQNSKTVFTMTDIKFNVPVNNSEFSLRNLSR
ncbi:MAG TPA: outer membrane lipoprotein-sorting protein [Spirochaetia bacterium]|nr:outer membrane lipoprotein-sorting protein [Spirochaetia bacterium]